MKTQQMSRLIRLAVIPAVLLAAAGLRGAAHAVSSTPPLWISPNGLEGDEDDFVQTALLHAGDVDLGDQLGRASIAMDGDTIVVGAYLEDGGEGDPMPSAGAVYVFERDLGGPNQWGQAAKLTASDAQAEDRFGATVSISGDTIVVGAEAENGGPGDPIFGAGAAYVYERDLGGPNNWGQSKKLAASDAQIADFFGHAASIHGDTIAVGAYDEDGGPGDPEGGSGAVYIFERDQGGPGQWGEVQILHAEEPEFFGWFGYSLALHADTLVIGALLGDGPVSDCGAVYIFERSTEGSGGWSQSIRLVSAEPEDGGYFGYSVAISGDIVVVGAPVEDGASGNPLASSGAGYVFDRDLGGPGNWGQSAVLNAEDPNEDGYFGQSAAIDGNRIVIGATGDDGEVFPSAESAGAAFLFEPVDGAGAAWLLKQILRHTDIEEFDALGSSVSISGVTIAAAAPGEDGGPGNPIAGAGAAIVFQQIMSNGQIFLPLVVRP